MACKYDDVSRLNTILYSIISKDVPKYNIVGYYIKLGLCIVSRYMGCIDTLAI